MKNKKSISFLAVLVSLLFLVSCEKAEMPTVKEQGKASNVTIVTRGANNEDLDYPIHVYAFTSSGECFAQEVVESPSADVRLSLPTNASYKIVAVAADKEDYELPSNPTITSVIKMKDTKTHCASHPLQMGFAEVNTGAAEASVRIQLNYQVCSFDASLLSMPVECSDPYISVGTCYEGVSFGGTLSGVSQATVKCTKTSGNDFSSGEVFLFPTQPSQTVFTVKYNDAGGDLYSSANYSSTLNAGVPYRITGTYNDKMMTITGSIIRSEWAEPVDFDFTFGKDGDMEEGDDGPDSDSEIYNVAEIPSVFSEWEGHFVADVTEIDEQTANLLLLSLQDWGDMTSSLNETNPTKAFEVADTYDEYGLTGWSIPTTTQAKILYQVAQYTDAGTTLFEALDAMQADPVCLTDSKGENVRYLCSGAERTYSFKTNSVLAAGKTVKNYHLRLVKVVKVKVEK